MTIFLPKISLQSKKFKHIAKYCHFYQFANLTIMLICVTPPEKEPLFQWAHIGGGLGGGGCLLVHSLRQRMNSQNTLGRPLAL